MLETVTTVINARSLTNTMELRIQGILKITVDRDWLLEGESRVSSLTDSPINLGLLLHRRCYPSIYMLRPNVAVKRSLAQNMLHDSIFRILCMIRRDTFSASSYGFLGLTNHWMGGPKGCRPPIFKFANHTA